MLDTVGIACPYCGEPVEILVDCSVASQEYVEDCPVCCQPMTLHVTVDESGAASVMARHENE